VCFVIQGHWRRWEPPCAVVLLSVQAKELIPFEDSAQPIVVAQNMDENGGLR